MRAIRLRLRVLAAVALGFIVTSCTRGGDTAGETGPTTEEPDTIVEDDTLYLFPSDYPSNRNIQLTQPVICTPPRPEDLQPPVELMFGNVETPVEAGGHTLVVPANALTPGANPVRFHIKAVGRPNQRKVMVAVNPRSRLAPNVTLTLIIDTAGCANSQDTEFIVYRQDDDMSIGTFPIINNTVTVELTDFSTYALARPQ